MTNKKENSNQYRTIVKMDRGTRLVCERRAESVDLESGERRRDKNSKLARLKLGYLKIDKNILGIFWNLTIIVKKLYLFPWDL